MEQTVGQQPGAGKPAAEARLLLPNICTTQSLLYAVVVGSLISLMFAIARNGVARFDWPHFALTSFFILWVVLVNMALLCRLRSHLDNMSLVRGVTLCFGSILLVTLLISAVAQWLQVYLFRLPVKVSLMQTIEHVLLTAILAGVSLRYLYLQELLRIQQQAELASRIQALQARIRPHFLFNSMNIIASLIESDPRLAEQVVEDLSELFRATLSDANQLVPLNREIELGKSYIHIESLRLGERLQLDWQLDEFNDSTLIPHLSLQPLLENAIYHGIQPLAEGGTITVTIRHDVGGITVGVRNPVSESTASPVESGRSNGLALENLQRRLQAYYGDRARFSAGRRISEAGAAFFEVNFFCPPPA